MPNSASTMTFPVIWRKKVGTSSASVLRFDILAGVRVELDIILDPDPWPLWSCNSVTL